MCNKHLSVRFSVGYVVGQHDLSRADTYTTKNKLSLLYFGKSVRWLRIWCCVEEVEEEAHITGVLVKFWSHNTALKPLLPLKGLGQEEALQSPPRIRIGNVKYWCNMRINPDLRNQVVPGNFQTACNAMLHGQFLHSICSTRKIYGGFSFQFLAQRITIKAGADLVRTITCDSNKIMIDFSGLANQCHTSCHTTQMLTLNSPS